jgi:hypothetical protein
VADIDKNTALIVAAGDGQVEILKELLEDPTVDPSIKKIRR